MKINGLFKTLDIYNQRDTNIKKTKTKTTENDNFTVSEEARDFQAVFRAVSKAPDVRQDKIDAIKKQIQEGTYNISSEDIANKMLSN